MIRLRCYTHARFKQEKQFSVSVTTYFKALRITLFKVRLLKTDHVYDSRYKTERYVDDVAQSVSTS